VATPKGMRLIQYPLNPSDSIHLYSNDNHIWIQLRRNVPTEQDIGRSSFKIAFSVHPGMAQKIGLELMNLAEKAKAKAKAATPKPAKVKA